MAIALLVMPWAGRAEPLEQTVRVEITSPASGAELRGTVRIMGTATVPDLQFYKVEFGRGSEPANWSVIGSTHNSPVIDGVLETWNTGAVPDGVYTLQLQAVRLDGNWDSFYVREVVVANDAPPPTETPLPTEVPSPTSTAIPTADVPTATAAPSPTVAPSPTAPPPTETPPVPEEEEEPDPAESEAETEAPDPDEGEQPAPDVVPALPLGWSAPISMSSPNASWFPAIAVDHRGYVHVTWCDTRAVFRGHREQVYYSYWNGQRWSEPNDIVPAGPDIERHHIAVDPVGNLHMLSGGSPRGMGDLTQSHRYVSATEAWNAAAWSSAHRISERPSYMGEIAIGADGVIHIIHDQQVPGEVEVEGRLYPVPSSDIYYRRSDDGGQTWSVPLNLYPSEGTGSARPRLKMDPTGGLHATWDEGWDRLSGDGYADYGVYMSSYDNGLTWRSPITIASPVTGTMQLTPAADGEGRVMLVWRSARSESIYYQWSQDGGQSWGEPGTIQGLYSRRWNDTPYDLYDMAVDGAGNVHLVVVARRSQDYQTPLDVYHLTWDGSSWSAPRSIYGQGGYPEYPRIVSSRGDQLYTVWFTRDELYAERQERLIWYAHARVEAPHIPPPPSPTPTLTPMPTATPEPTPEPTPLPTVVPGISGLPRGMATEMDDLALLALAVLPVLGLAGLASVVRRFLGGRNRS
jgi:hypothetical protein